MGRASDEPRDKPPKSGDIMISTNYHRSSHDCWVRNVAQNLWIFKQKNDILKWAEWMPTCCNRWILKCDNLSSKPSFIAAGALAVSPSLEAECCQQPNSALKPLQLMYVDVPRLEAMIFPRNLKGLVLSLLMYWWQGQTGTGPHMCFENLRES